MVTLETIDLTAIFGSLGVILALTACMAGVGWRTWAKYHDKIQSGEVQAFDRKFFYQALVAFGGSIVVALPLLAAATEMINQWAGSVGLLIAWLLTAGWAYSVNDGTNGVIKLIEKKAVVRAIKNGELDQAIKQRLEQLKDQDEGDSTPQESQVQQPSSTQTTEENSLQSNQGKDPV